MKRSKKENKKIYGKPFTKSKSSRREKGSSESGPTLFKPKMLLPEYYLTELLRRSLCYHSSTVC